MPEQIPHKISQALMGHWRKLSHNEQVCRTAAADKLLKAALFHSLHCSNLPKSGVVHCVLQQETGDLAAHTQCGLLFTPKSRTGRASVKGTDGSILYLLHNMINDQGECRPGSSRRLSGIAVYRGEQLQGGHTEAKV